MFRYLVFGVLCVFVFVRVYIGYPNIVSRDASLQVLSPVSAKTKTPARLTAPYVSDAPHPRAQC